MHDPLALLASRRSVRELSAEPIDDGTVTRLLEAACAAPSAHNAQPWRFIVVESPERRLSLADRLRPRLEEDLRRDGVEPDEIARRAAQARRRLIDAPLAVLVCLDEAGVPVRSSERLQQAEQTMAIQGVALAGGWLLLAAHALGLAACWYSAPLFAPGEVRESLAVPGSWNPQALVLIGRTAKASRRSAARRAAAAVTVRA